MPLAGAGYRDYVAIMPVPRPRRDPVAYAEYLLAIHQVGTPSGAPPGWPPRLSGPHPPVPAYGRGAGAPGSVLETIGRLGAEVGPPRVLTGASLTSEPADR